MTDAQLEGKVAVVTGASRGIGQAITLSLILEGVDVVMSSRSTNTLSQAVEQLASAAPSGRRQARVEPHPSDVRDPAQMEALMAKAIDTFGRLDVLINNAGVGLFEPLAEQSVCRLADRDRDQSEWRLLRVPSGDSTVAARWRWVDHQR